ncbi:MAG: DDE transposase family protein [Cyanobacteria bacterium P01_A01_bin.114]
MAETPSTQSTHATEPAQWHIAQDGSGQCKIVTQAELAQLADDQKQAAWGPFKDQNEAIARRVGLIRAGKCKPV